MIVRSSSPRRRSGRFRVAQRGFTLIELAVVVAIVGLLLGGLLLPLATQVDAQRVKGTEDDMGEIKQALFGYLVGNNPMPGTTPPQVVTRLPCPDCMEATDGDCAGAGSTVGDGREDFDTADPRQCATYYGFIPWVTLGVSQFDAWNRIYRYAVWPAYADGIPDAACGNSTVTIGLCTSGDGNELVVRDSAGGNIVADDMAAVIVSLGDEVSRQLCSEAADPSPNQDENLDCDSEFVASTRIEDPGNEFDDLVNWVSPNVIKSKLVDVNLLP